MLLRLFLDNTRPAIWIQCFSKSKKAVLSLLSCPYTLANLLGNRRSWFVIGGFCVCFFVSRFIALFLKKHRQSYLSSQFFCLLYTETWQVQIPKVKLFLLNFQTQRKYRYRRVKTNWYVPTHWQKFEFGACSI